MAIIGRPKTQNPRSIVASIRLTAGEKKELEKRYGSTSKGLRAALDKLLGTSVNVRVELARASGKGALAAMVPEVVVTDAVIPPDAYITGKPAVTVGHLEAGEEVRPVDWTKPLEVAAEPDPIEAKDVETPKHYHKPAVKAGAVYYRGGTAYQPWECACGASIERKAT